MASTDPVERALTTALGPGVPLADAETPEIARVWTVSHVEVALASPVNERRLRSLWGKRQGGRAAPLLLVTPTGDSGVRVLGPRRADEPVRQVEVGGLVRALADIEGRPRQQAAASLAAALERLDQAGIPGIVIKGLLTKHLLTRRLPRDHPDEWRQLEKAAGKVRAGRSWLENFTALGYSAEQRPDRGYLIRHRERPVAVVHPFPDPTAFSRMTPEGSPPEGVLVADCRKEGARWGLLTTDERFRLFPAETAVGAATGRYLEIDITTAAGEDWAYIGLLAPESLEPGGLLERLVDEAAALGSALRETRRATDPRPRAAHAGPRPRRVRPGTPAEARPRQPQRPPAHRGRRPPPPVPPALLPAPRGSARDHPG